MSRNGFNVGERRNEITCALNQFRNETGCGS